MTEWLFTRKAVVFGAVLLLGAVIVGLVFRESTLGNIASIVGLAVSVLGFVVTIWTLVDARQQIKDASARAERAIAQASEEAQRAVRGIATQLRVSDCDILRSGVEDLRQASQDTRWPRAIYRCQECRRVASRLAHDRHLTEEEASALRAAGDDLQLIQRFIEKNRSEAQPGLLQDKQLQCLDDLLGLLARIQGRLHHEPLWFGEETSIS